MGELREFVYIDNESLNSNLSSLGKGIPSEITRATEDQTEKGGQGGAKVAGIGGKGEYLQLDRDEIETTLDVTAPYRFQDLLDEISGQGIEIKENPDPRGVSRSDLVKVEGKVQPMSMLKIAMAFDAIELFADDDFNQALRTIGESLTTETEREEFAAVNTIVDMFSGNEYPLRIETGDDIYCTSLEQQYMRQSVFEAFNDNLEYELFGRVKQHIPGDQEWNPVHALKILEQYTTEEDLSEEFIDDLRSGVEDFDISIKDEDMQVRGHTAVIEPIAMYW